MALSQLLQTAFEKAFESWLLAYLLNSVWQIPLVFIAALVASRLAQHAGPQMQHRVWVGALLLQAALPACHMRFGELGRHVWGLLLSFFPANSSSGQTQVFINAGTVSRVALPWQITDAMALTAAIYLVSLVYFVGRFAWGLWATNVIRRQAKAVNLSLERARTKNRMERLFRLGSGSVDLAVSPGLYGPASIGILRHTLLLPPQFLHKLNSGDLDALLAHELAHMRRADFAKNVLYGIISLPVAYHPVFRLTRKRLAETRELVCDQMAAEAVGGQEPYARSLLRLASLLSDNVAPRVLHAIGILDANIFERRVMQLTRKHPQIQRKQSLAIVAACALIAIATCSSALALRMDVADTSNRTAPPHPKSVNLKSDLLTLVKKGVPVYPAEAKKDGISGTVALAAVISKTGEVENLRVLSGPPQLQRSALDAVRQWQYQPYLLNGDPIEVKTTIKILFTLAK